MRQAKWARPNFKLRKADFLLNPPTQQYQRLRNISRTGRVQAPAESAREDRPIGTVRKYALRSR